MNTRSFNILLILGFCFISRHAQAQEFRLGLEYDKNITNRVSLNSKVQFCNIKVPSNNYYASAQLKLAYSITSGFSVGSSLRYTVFPDKGEEYHYIDDDEKLRMTIDASMRSQKNDKDFRLIYRMRFQYSTEWEGKGNVYMRNRLKLKYYKMDEMRPYIAFEAYQDLHPFHFSRARLYIGSDIQLFNLDLELYFITEFDVLKEYDFSSQLLGLVFKF